MALRQRLNDDPGIKQSILPETGKRVVAPGIFTGLAANDAVLGPQWTLGEKMMNIIGVPRNKVLTEKFLSRGKFTADDTGKGIAYTTRNGAFALLGAAIMGPAMGAIGGGMLAHKLQQNFQPPPQSAWGKVGYQARKWGLITGGALTGAAVGSASFVPAFLAGWGGLNAMEISNYKKDAREWGVAGNERRRFRDSARFGSFLSDFDGQPGLWGNSADRDVMINRLSALLQYIKNKNNPEEKRGEMFKELSEFLPPRYKDHNDPYIPEAEDSTDTVIQLLHNATTDALYLDAQQGKQHNNSGRKQETLPNMQNILQGAYLLSQKIEAPQTLTPQLMVTYGIGQANDFTNDPRILTELQEKDAAKETMIDNLSDIERRDVWTSLDPQTKQNTAENIRIMAELLATQPDPIQHMDLNEVLKNNFASLLATIMDPGFDALRDSLLGANRHAISGGVNVFGVQMGGQRNTNMEDPQLLQNSYRDSPLALLTAMETAIPGTRDSILGGVQQPTIEEIESSFEGKGHTLYGHLTPVNQDDFWDRAAPDDGADMISALNEVSGKEIYNALDPIQRDATHLVWQTNNQQELQESIEGRLNAQLQVDRTIRPVQSFAHHSETLNKYRFSDSSPESGGDGIEDITKSTWENIKKWAGPVMMIKDQVWDKMSPEMKQRLFKFGRKSKN